MLNNRIKILLILSIVVLLLTTGCSSDSKDEIVAEVDGYKITKEQFDEEFQMKKNVYAKKYGEDFINQELSEGYTVEEYLEEELLLEIIQENLLEKELDRLNLSVTDEDIDRAMNEIYISKLGDENKYNEYLDYLGVSDEFLRKSVYRELMINKYGDYFVEQIDLSDELIRQYYEENKNSFVKVRASHILVKTEQEAKEIYDRLKEGEDFATLAATKSIDNQTSGNGGDLGYITRGSMAQEYKEIEYAAFNLEVGDISNLIKTDIGYHIVKVVDKVDSFEELKEEVIESFKRDKYKEELDRMIEEADVKIYNQNDE